jgi:hypothetical protein
MSRTTKIIVSFAAVGFLLPYVFLAYSSIRGTLWGELQFRLCPTSIMCMGLDNASTSTAIFVWFIIGVSNAVLYAAAGIAIAWIVRLVKPQPAT